MRIDLPLCNLKTCRYCFDGNCSNKNKHDVCEYAFLKSSKDRIVEKLENASYMTECTFDEDGWSNNDNYEVVLLDKAIEIVKEEM